MIQHYVLSINPQAEYDWDKYVIRNPITGERPDFTNTIVEAVNNQSGSYLVAIEVNVKVLEKAPMVQSESKNGASRHLAIASPKTPELIAS